MLEEVAAILCKECKGGCCSHFPVYVLDKETGVMFKNPTFWDDKDGEACIWFNTNGQKTECHYRALGGCPNEKKPELCRYWYCAIFDEFVLGELRPITVYGHSKKITRKLMKVLA
jgi:hypothetical protein